MPNYKFYRCNRLLSTESFDSVMKGPDLKLKAGHFIFLVASNELSFGRLGLVIPKKRLSKATLRNYLKRQIREAFRLNKDLFKGFDLVVILRAPIKSSDLPAVRSLLNNSMLSFSKSTLKYSA